MQQGHVAPESSVDWQGRRLTDFDLDEQKERQRMPEPMPTAWLSPVRPQPPSALIRQFGSGLLGLTVGLAIAVPAVLWHKGRIDPLAIVGLTAADLGLAMAAPATATNVKVREPAAATSRVVVAETPRVVASEMPRTVPVDVVRPPAPPAAAPAASASAPRGNQTASTMVVLQPVPVAPPKPEPPRSEVLLGEARRLIGEGEFSAARRVLEDQALTATPTARFLLAETYDPNFLAARGIRSVRAEVPRAVELYKQALDGGIDAARQRLAALRP